MSATVRRGVRLLRRVGGEPPRHHRWACQIVSSPGDGLAVRIDAPDGLDDADLDEPGRQLHAVLTRHLPPMLRAGARVEVGAVRTDTRVGARPIDTRRTEYALVTCADVVVTLVDDLRPALAVPWRGTCLPADVDPRLPVVLGPSAVLSLTAATLELSDQPGQARAAEKVGPAWMSARPAARSPYPPHGAPPGLDEVPEQLRDEITYWAGHAERWMRPMRTTRSSRGRYEVRAALPSVTPGPALWVESLVSLDTRGRYWHASLSVGQEGGRWWLTQPWSVEIRADELLEAAVGEVEPPRPALDRDPVDGESFGWAPALLLDRSAATLRRKAST